MRRLIVADAHVGQRVGDADAMTGLLERASASGVDEVVYLGDAFQYLIGMEKFWTSSVRRVIAAWDGLRERGGRVVLIEGNRDFFLDEQDLASRIDHASRCYQFTSGATVYRLVHGDRVNSRDLQYRFWSRVSKSTTARMWARMLPRSLANAIVRSMEARLAATNVRFRYSKPVGDLSRAARDAWEEGVDVLLWGHFHTLWQLQRGGHVALVVPAWLEFRCVLVVDDEGWGWAGEGLTPLPGPPTMSLGVQSDQR